MPLGAGDTLEAAARAQLAGLLISWPSSWAEAQGSLSGAN